MSDNFYSREIELCIIGSLLTWFDELKPRIVEMTADDFYYPTCRAVFEAIQKQTGLSESNDIALMSTNLAPELIPCVKESVTYVSTSVYFDRYLMALKEMAANRRIKQSVSALALTNKKVSLADLRQIIDNEQSNTYVKSYTDKAKADLQRFIDNVGVPKERIKMGFRTLDAITGGLRIPSVMMLGAYPSVGKTAFALNIAMRQDRPVVFFSLEMSSEMIYERVIATQNKIDYALFSSQALNARQKKTITDSGKQLKEKPFYVFDDMYDVEGHSAVIANLKPKLVIVDYLQKVRTSKKTENRRNEIDYISGLYKQIAKHNHCAIILLSQLAREKDRQQPTMSSLKESGALEADGDYVCILHRPYVVNKDNPEIRPEQAYLLIDKNKFGDTGKLPLHFNGTYQQFCEVEKGDSIYSHTPVTDTLPAEWREGVE